MTAITRRPVRDADRAFLLQLYAETRADLAALPLPDPALRQMLEMQFDAQAQAHAQGFPGHTWEILMLAGAEVGQIRVARPLHEIRAIDLSLLETARGQGSGSHVLRALQAEAEAAGLPLRLSVEHGNPRARALYERLGFLPEGDRGTHLAMVWSPPGGAGGFRKT